MMTRPSGPLSDVHCIWETYPCMSSPGSCHSTYQSPMVVPQPGCQYLWWMHWTYLYLTGKQPTEEPGVYHWQQDPQRISDCYTTVDRENGSPIIWVTVLFLRCLPSVFTFRVYLRDVAASSDVMGKQHALSVLGLCIVSDFVVINTLWSLKALNESWYSN
jgi:hypothetical protein